MIPLTRLKGSLFYVNIGLIETIEATPDTVVTLSNGHKYVVEESPKDIAETVGRVWRSGGRGRGRRGLSS